MEILLVGIYAFFVWLVFVKFRWLPWNIATQVIAAIIPVAALTVLILTLNVVAPSSKNLRIYHYQIPVVSQVSGRVIEVDVQEGNRPVRQGDILFRIDPTPYASNLKQLQAQLIGAEGDVRRMREETHEAVSATGALRSKLELARKRAEQYAALARTGAGSKFDLEAAQADLAELENQTAASVAKQREIDAQLNSTVNGDVAEVAKIKADIAQAQWQLDQTVTRSPCDCTVVNLQLRPGAYVAAQPFSYVMTLIERRSQILALFMQNEVRLVSPGDEAEIVLPMAPGRVFKGTVDSVVWDQGLAQTQTNFMGQIMPVPAMTAPAGGFIVKFDLYDQLSANDLAAGASGAAAIYTQHMKFIHLLRKVIMRVDSYLNYIVPKL